MIHYLNFCLQRFIHSHGCLLMVRNVPFTLTLHPLSHCIHSHIPFTLTFHSLTHGLTSHEWSAIPHSLPHSLTNTLQRSIHSHLHLPKLSLIFFQASAPASRDVKSRVLGDSRATYAYEVAAQSLLQTTDTRFLVQRVVGSWHRRQPSLHIDSDSSANIFCEM